MLTFKNLLLGRGLYLIGRNPRSAFDIIESLTGLLYPLKWEHPKILSYESRYEIFESPVPLIYYFDSEKLDYDMLRGLDLTDKCLLYYDSNAVQEFCATPGMKEFPPKLLASLEKELSKITGKYSSHYSVKKATLTSENYDALLEDYEDPVQEKLDCWKIRECFFDFMRELLDGYQESYRESTILERGSLDSDAIFDFTKFSKQKSGLKNGHFVQSFVKTSLFSRFIECRIHPETESQAIYYNYFDFIQRRKKESSKQDVLKMFKKNQFEERKRATMAPAPNCEVVSELQWLPYEGRMPALDPALMVEPRTMLTKTGGLVVDDDFDLGDPAWVSKLPEEKWARTNIEMIHTVWFLCLKIFLQTDHQPAYASLAVFAYDKIIEMEADRIHPRLDCLKSVAFLLGIFRESAKLQRIIRKFAKKIEENGQLASIYSEFTKGLLAQKKSNNVSSELKRNEANLEPTKSSENLEAKKDPFDLIPVAIKSEFSTNVHCPKCGTNIPLELILARMSKNPEKELSVCPNQACRCEYEPKFDWIFLKQCTPTMMTQESVKLMSPLNLLLQTKQFLEVNEPVQLMDVRFGKAAPSFWKPVLEHPFLPYYVQPPLLFFPASTRPPYDAASLHDSRPVLLRNLFAETQNKCLVEDHDHLEG